jgi:alanyl-tRNA synthetase
MLEKCKPVHYYDHMELNEIRSRFLKFYKERGHAIIPSASLVPENDPTTLFTGSGMQPLLPYLLGESHPEGKRLANSQKSFRAEDIDEVGDNRHTTFFEMLGNWSFGDYWKDEQLSWFFEFLTKELSIDLKKIYITVFSGGEGISQDDESIEIWQKLFKEKSIDAAYIKMGSEEAAAERGMKAGERIFGYEKKNWWSRAGSPEKMPAGEPGGPDSEVFYDFGEHDENGQPRHRAEFGKYCHPNCDCGRFLEIGNSVFMEFKKKADGTFEKLAQRNVDFGGGLERITAAANDKSDIFKIDLLWDVISILEKEFGKKYDESPAITKSCRVITDHIRAAVFLLSDGVFPANKERGYVLRRLIRKAVFEAHRLGSDSAGWMAEVAEATVGEYKSHYHELNEGRENIVAELKKEGAKFLATLEGGVKIFYDIVESKANQPGEKKHITADDAFLLFTTYGFPIDLTREKALEMGFSIDLDGFHQKFKEHQALSRTSSAGTFKGGLADASEKTVKLHTAHHLLLKALQTVLGPQVKQRGSNITSERLRLDFSYDKKMTDEEKKEVEKIVNEKISENLPVIRSEMAREDAEKLGAEHEFGQKYPDRVSVYSIGPKDASQEKPQFEKAFSIEFCGGPHVAHTGEIGHFTLAKEEAVAAGIRRARGVIG